MSRLILASASRSRARMLKNAGISTEAIASGVDEDAIKQDGLVDGLLMDDIAMALAQARRWPSLHSILMHWSLVLTRSWFARVNIMTSRET